MTTHIPAENKQPDETVAQYRTRTAPWRSMAAVRQHVLDARHRTRVATDKLATLLDSGALPASQRAHVKRWHAEMAEAYGLLRELDTIGWREELRAEIQPKGGEQ